MVARIDSELDSLKRELASIISELESISASVRNNFIGIGNDRCSNGIDSVINKYKAFLRKLDSIDLSGLTAITGLRKL